MRTTEPTKILRTKRIELLKTISTEFQQQWYKFSLTLSFHNYSQQIRITESLPAVSTEVSGSAQLRSCCCTSTHTPETSKQALVKNLLPKQASFLQFACTVNKTSKNACGLSWVKKYCLSAFKPKTLYQFTSKTTSTSKRFCSYSYVCSLTFACIGPDLKRTIKAFYSHHCAGGELQFSGIV